MPRQKLEVTTQVETVTTVELSAKAKRMLLERFAEYDALDNEIEEKKARQGRIKQEVDALFAKEGQGAALIDGAAIEGNKAKWVIGTQTVTNETQIIHDLGISPAEYRKRYKSTKDKKPYLKLTVKGKKEDRDDE